MDICVLMCWLIVVIWWVMLFVWVYDVVVVLLSYIVMLMDGVKLVVQESGDLDGVLVILIYGLFGSCLNWDVQVQSVELCGFWIIMYDLCGYGLLDKLFGVQLYCDGICWGDDFVVVIDGMYVCKLVVVGWLFGGVVILNYFV